LEKHSLEKFNVDPFHWLLFLESSNEDVIGTKDMFIETSPQYDDNDDEKYDDG
jgi:hypothetical protein